MIDTHHSSFLISEFGTGVQDITFVVRGRSRSYVDKQKSYRLCDCGERSKESELR